MGENTSKKSPCTRRQVFFRNKQVSISFCWYSLGFILRLASCKSRAKSLKYPLDFSFISYISPVQLKHLLYKILRNTGKYFQNKLPPYSFIWNQICYLFCVFILFLFLFFSSTFISTCCPPWHFSLFYFIFSCWLGCPSKVRNRAQGGLLTVAAGSANSSSAVGRPVKAKIVQMKMETKSSGNSKLKQALKGW